jgi:hypothetical protein
MCSCITELFRKPKVDHIHLVTTFADAHQKVIWFDIPISTVSIMSRSKLVVLPMDKVLGVDVFDTR